MEQFKNEIRKLVSNNKIEEALDRFMDWTKANKDLEIHNSLITLKSRFRRVKQQENLGIVEFTDTLREQTLIANTILELLDQINTGADSEVSEIADREKNYKTILFLASSPSDEAKLQLEKEFIRIFSSLQESEIEYSLKAEWAVDAGGFMDAVLKHEPNIIHFSGHGEGDNPYSEEGGGIILQDSKGDGKLVSGKAFGNMFRVFVSRINIQVVILNSCFSKDQVDDFCQVLHYVIGMKAVIGDETAIKFSEGFYTSMAKYDDIEFAFKLARSRIEIEGLEDSDKPILLKNCKEIEF